MFIMHRLGMNEHVQIRATVELRWDRFRDLGLHFSTGAWYWSIDLQPVMIDSIVSEMSQSEQDL